MWPLPLCLCFSPNHTQPLLNCPAASAAPSLAPLDTQLGADSGPGGPPGHTGGLHDPRARLRQQLRAASASTAAGGRGFSSSGGPPQPASAAAHASASASLCLLQAPHLASQGGGGGGPVAARHTQGTIATGATTTTSSHAWNLDFSFELRREGMRAGIDAEGSRGPLAPVILVGTQEEEEGGEEGVIYEGPEGVGSTEMGMGGHGAWGSDNTFMDGPDVHAPRQPSQQLLPLPPSLPAPMVLPAPVQPQAECAQVQAEVSGGGRTGGSSAAAAGAAASMVPEGAQQGRRRSAGARACGACADSCCIKLVHEMGDHAPS